MKAPPAFALRAARDRLSELLGLGNAYPIQGTVVRDEGLKVPFGSTAKVPLSPTQADCSYALHHRDGSPEAAQAATGNGGLLVLETPKIEQDITYRIRVTKLASGLDAWLHHEASVRVGLDQSLPARILDVPFLLPAADPNRPRDPGESRIIDHAIAVRVAIDSSQEGVAYRLVSITGGEETTLSVQDQGGDLGTIVLQSIPMLEDIDLRVRATKRFDPKEGIEDQSELLDAVLPLRVRADTRLSVVAVDPVLPFAGKTAMRISGTQTSARYALFVRPIRDDDFIHDGSPDTPTVMLALPADGAIGVRGPESPAPWSKPEGFEQAGESVSGTGGDLDLPLGPLSEDSLVLVQASKVHQVPGGTVGSQVGLVQVAAVLVGPDPAVVLAAVGPVSDDRFTGSVTVTGGATGTYYHLSADPAGPDIGRPVYFHRLPTEGLGHWRGIGALMVEVDLVVAQNSSPAPPRWDPGDLPSGSLLRARAVKAHTGLAVDLTAPVGLDASDGDGAEDAPG